MENTEFEKILIEHKAAYPLMEPEDFIKLAYQSEFGPGHMITDEGKTLENIISEWKAAPPCGKPPEAIGGGLCRFHLSGADFSETAARLLFRLFSMTAGSVKGTAEGLERKLGYLDSLGIEGMREKISEYRGKGCPPVSHSSVFRENYAPHYRLLRKEYAFFFSALLGIARLSERKEPVIIAADGRCGSGKTSFAKLVSEIFPCNVFHTDDFYLPVSGRSPDWKNTPGGNMDFERLLSEVVIPAKKGEDIIHRRYSCMEKSFEKPERISAKQLNIIEGSYSMNPLLTDSYDMTIFLDCTKEKQSERLKKREGEHYRDFKEIWIPLEESHIKKYDVIGNAGIVADTSDLF